MRVSLLPIDRLKSRAGVGLGAGGGWREPEPTQGRFRPEHGFVCVFGGMCVPAEGDEIFLYPANSSLHSPHGFHKQLARLLNFSGVY